MQNIRITFVIPVYNVERYLERCVNSIICRSSTMYEILLVNDGSTDRSSGLCEELGVRHEGIVRVIHKENGGLASARNRGIEEARGEYLVFVDSDDWLDGGFIEKIDDVINRFHPDLIKFGYRRIEGQKEKYIIAPYVNEGYYSDSKAEELFLAGLGNGYLFDTNRVFVMSACMSVYKKERMDEFALRFRSEREILNEDILFNLEYLLKIRSAYVLHDIFYNYDCREGSLTQRYKPLMYERKCRLFAFFESLMQEAEFRDAEEVRRRYAQFVLEHLYDCMVMEMQWNQNARDRNDNIMQILKDSRLEKAKKDYGQRELSKKAHMMLKVFSLKNPALLNTLYHMSHKAADFKRRVMK